MAPPKSYQQQQQRSRPVQLNQPPTFVTEQTFNATIENLVQEMKKELDSIRNESRSAAAMAPTHQRKPQPQLHPKQPTRSAFAQPATQPVTVQLAESDQIWIPEEIGFRPKYNISGTGKPKSGSKAREGSYRPPKPPPLRVPGEYQTAGTKEGSTSYAGVKEVQCIACRSDDVPVFQAARLPCKHHWCNTCLHRIFDVSTRDRRFMPPKCCSDECIALKHVEKLFDNGFKRRWNAKYREYMD